MAALLANLRKGLIHQSSRTRTTGKDGTSQSKLGQHKLSYPSLSRALQHSWKETTSNATKVLRPVTVFSILGVHQILTSQPPVNAHIDPYSLKQLVGNIKRNTAHLRLRNPLSQILKP
jgi:hypothetical protein